MAGKLRNSAQKVQDALAALGLILQVVELPASTRSAREAAEAVGCQVEQIAKSLIFRGRQSGKPILVIASGRNRVNEQTLAAWVGEPVDKADAEFVRQRTGFVIGGVPPLGHSEPLETYLDQELFELDVLWAAAGTPHAVFCLTADELARMTNGRVVVIT